jgi:hypothetical protein
MQLLLADSRSSDSPIIVFVSLNELTKADNPPSAAPFGNGIRHTKSLLIRETSLWIVSYNSKGG